MKTVVNPASWFRRGHSQCNPSSSLPHRAAITASSSPDPERETRTTPPSPSATNLGSFLSKYRRPLLRFVPTLLVEIGWWTWALLDPPTRLGRFAEPSPYVGYYYYMTLTMTLGSLVAGATSEGGGAVAFPVMTLALGVPPPVARDFSFAIQSFGMTCASITIFGLGVPIDLEAIVWGSIGGAVGLGVCLVLVAPNLPPAYAKMFFVSVWVAFAVALWRLNHADKGRKLYESAVESDEALLLRADGVAGVARGETVTQNGADSAADAPSPCAATSSARMADAQAGQAKKETDAAASAEEGKGFPISDNKGQEEGSDASDDFADDEIIEKTSAKDRAAASSARFKRLAVITTTGLFGGLCTSIAGSGLDMATFSILTLYYAVDEKVATPTSVVLMAGNAVLGVVFRALGLGGRYAGDEATYVWNFVSVCVPVVVIGAPLGATISARLSRTTIAGLLYVLDAVQFVTALGVVRPWEAPPPNDVWLCVSSGLTLVLGFVFFTKVATWGERRDRDSLVCWCPCR